MLTHEEVVEILLEIGYDEGVAIEVGRDFEARFETDEETKHNS